MITGLNGFIATTPCKAKSLQVNIKDGWGEISNRSTLTELIVLIGNKEKEIEPGDTVYVAGDSFLLQAWAKTEVEVDGKVCIIVPLTSLQFVKKLDPGPWTDPVGVR